MADPKPITNHPHLTLRGRIESIRRVSGQNGPMFAHLVKLAAPDEYTAPATVRVMSKDRCGEEGGKFDQVVSVGGYARTYETTDEETRRKVRVPTADNTLTVVG